MALTLSATAHSEVGLVRSNNQDSAYTSPRMLMVADGMGGAAAGDLASAVATWELKKTDEKLDDLIDHTRAQRLDADVAGEDQGEGEGVRDDADLTDGGPADEALDDEHPGDLADVLTVMAGALVRANDRLVELVEDDPSLSGMGTTVCGFVLAQDRLAVVNIGDSRAYLIRNGALHRVTRDHSWVQTLVDEGRITEQEALEHPHRSLVLRVLNGASQHEPDLGWLDVVPGDRLLVCTDGLCGLVTDAAIEAVVTSAAQRSAIIDGLVELAHDAGGHDNITLIVADVEQDGPLDTAAMIGAAATVSAPTGLEQTSSFAQVETDAPIEAAAADERAMTEEERYALSGRRRPSALVKLSLAILLPVLALAGGGFGWYQFTQTRFFIGPAEQHVALYRGVPDTILGFTLSTLLETDETRIADLPPYYAAKVQGTIGVETLEAARTTMDELRVKSEQCIAQRRARAEATAPSPTPELTPTPDVTPDATPDPNATDPGGDTIGPHPGGTGTPAVSGTSLSPTPTVAPTGTPSPVTAPEEC